MKVGAFVPQGWRMDLVGIEGAHRQWQTMVEVAQRMEAYNYDTAWLFDHFHTIPKPTQEPTFECWMSTAALAQATSRIRIGQMVGCTMYRHPAVLAKMAATVDAISNGRLDFGLGAGWYMHETLAYGFDFPRPAVRIAMLDEALSIVRGMFTQELFSFKGRYYTVGTGRIIPFGGGPETELEGVICQPKPVQQPAPPFWIGGGGEHKTLKVVARHADYSNYWTPSLETVCHKNTVLDAHCEALGRDPATLRRSVCLEIMFGSTEEAERLQRRRLSNTLTGMGAQEMIDRLAAYRDQGRIDTLIAYFPDAAFGDSLQRFAEEVMPALR